jgi:hypothetical protein
MTDETTPVQVPSTPALDFSKVETLRRHMLLTVTNMAKLFGVSRMTYYGWVNGKSIRKTNELAVRRVLKQLLNVMATENWPTDEAICASQTRRMNMLLERLGADRKQEIQSLVAE